MVKKRQTPEPDTQAISASLDRLGVRLCDASPQEIGASSAQEIRLTDTQKSQLNLFLTQAPSLIARNAMNGAYKLHFPEGVQGTLVRMRNGEWITAIRGDNGKIAANAGLVPVEPPVLLGVFSVMSIATGQYFLKTIDKKMTIINRKLDEILDFLYGDKKAELISEVSFVQYVYENFSQIASNPMHAEATLTSIQSARKVAVRDIEFYMEDMDSMSKKNYSRDDFEKCIPRMQQTRKCLELSLQLYAMATLMEVCFSGIFNPSYLESLKASVHTYVSRCNQQIFLSFSLVRFFLQDRKNGLFTQFENNSHLIQAASAEIKRLEDGKVSEIGALFRRTLDGMAGEKTFFVTPDARLYLSGEID